MKPAPNRLEEYYTKSLFLFSIITTYFYGSYVTRELFQIVGSETLESIKSNNQISINIILAFVLSGWVSMLCLKRYSRIGAIPSGVQRFDKRQRILFLLSLTPFILLILDGYGQSYESIHQKITTTLYGKTLYLIYLYYSWVLGVSLKSGGISKQSITESLILLLMLTFILPLRSMILINILVFFIVGRVPLRKAILYCISMLILFLFIAMYRGSAFGPSSDELVNQISMLLFGGGFQVDLYLIAVDHGIKGSPQLTHLLEPYFQDYFAEGGGVGSFLPLELAHILPISAASFIVALLPLGLLLIPKRSTFILIAVIVAGIQSLIILRNPFSSWINGYIFMVAVTYYAYRKKNHIRRADIRVAKSRWNIASVGNAN